MEFIQTLLPRFDESWIADCEMVVANNGGKPPHIVRGPHPGKMTYAYPSVVDEENQAEMEAYLRYHHSDTFGRFAVLRYLSAASLANVPSDGGWATTADGGFIKVDDDEGDAASEALRARAHKVLVDFADRLAPESIFTAEQALWEFKQAILLRLWERLKRLGERHRTLTDQSSYKPSLMIARAFWLPNSQTWAPFVLDVASGAEGDELPWEDFIENGYQGSNHLLATCIPPESHEALNRDAVIDAIAYLAKVPAEILGPHWGILADCWSMAGAPEECAKIWEQHGVEILKPAEDFAGRRADEILLLPNYQLQIADLCAQAGRSDKEIDVLESLRLRHPRLPGVNRRLAECYLRKENPDLDAATQCIHDEAGADEAFSHDSIVRLLLHQAGRSQEAQRCLDEAREKYESSISSVGQRTAIQNVLKLTWKPFEQLSPDVQRDWVAGLWWCYGEHLPSLDETERAWYAVVACTRALESHLREKLFEPLLTLVTRSEMGQVRDAKLRSFFEGKHIDLGAMLEALGSADATVSGVAKRLWDLLTKRSSRPRELRSPEYREIYLIRNPSSHESRRNISGETPERARRCAELCQKFLSILESPPGQPRPGQPAPKR